MIVKLSPQAEFFAELLPIFGTVDNPVSVGAIIVLKDSSSILVVPDADDGVPRMVSVEDVTIVDPALPKGWQVGLIEDPSISMVLGYDTLVERGVSGIGDLQNYAPYTVQAFKAFMANLADEERPTAG